MTSPFESHDAFRLACKAFNARYSSPPSASADATAQDLPGPSRTNAGWQWVEHKSVLGHGYLHRQVTWTRFHRNLRDDEDEDEDEDEPNLEDDEDPAATTSSRVGNGRSDVVVEQDVVFSRTYRCPMLCLRAWAEDGAPFPLSSLLKLRILTPPNPPLPTAQTAAPDSPPRPDAIMLDPSSPFPLLQQTEHPTTGAVVWSVHPCKVAEAVQVVLASELGSGSGSDAGTSTDTSTNPKGTGDLTLGSDTGDGDRIGDNGDIARGGLNVMGKPTPAPESASTSAPEHSVRWLEAWMMLSSTIVDLTYP